MLVHSKVWIRIHTMFMNIDVGDRSHVEIDDLDDDGKFELIIGNTGGGLNYFELDDVVGVKKVGTTDQSTFDFTMYYKTENTLNISVHGTGDQKVNISVFNVTGKKLITDQFINSYDLNLSTYKHGLYLISVQNENEVKTQKTIFNP